MHNLTTTPERRPDSDNGDLPTPANYRLRAERLTGRREEKRKRLAWLTKNVDKLDQYLAVSDQVTSALQKLSEQLFEELLGSLQEKLSIALQEILEQPLEFHAAADFKRGAAVVEFSIRRGGCFEDIQRGQGGSVQNILSVCLRMFALSRLDDKLHRGFLVLDEQDCWLRPELVPKLVDIVYQFAREFRFQVLMISHHDIGLFERYADRIYRLDPIDDRVAVVEVNAPPAEQDSTY